MAQANLTIKMGISFACLNPVIAIKQVSRLGKTPLLPLFLLWLLAFWPLLKNGYPTIGDGLIHFYRLVQFDHLLSQGIWFPRWATDMGYGYGYPLFNYTPPLVYYGGSLFHALGLSYAHSLIAMYGVGLALAGSGAYLLARHWGGMTGGLMAAAAYLFSPYLHFNILARGAVSETFALGLLPWVLWSYTRLSQQPNRWLVAAAASLYAALCLTHVLSALVALPLLGVIILLNQPNHSPNQPNHQYTNTLNTLLALLWGIGLAAYFLLPALLETNLVQIHQLTAPSDLDFRNHFLSLGQLFAWPRPFDERLVFQAIPPSLSLFTLAMALFPAGFKVYDAVRHKSNSSRFSQIPVLLWLTFLLFSFFILPISRPLWEWMPQAHIVQFPWRLVGPASLLLALLVGWGWAKVKGRWTVVIPSFMVFGYLYLLPWTFAAASTPPPAAPTIADLPRYEKASGQLGTTSTGEFLPHTVSQLPDPDSLLVEYDRQLIIPRLRPLPDGVTLSHQTAALTGAEAHITAQQAVTLTFNIFAFPGWQATLDDQPIPITPSWPHGLITVPVPAGQHRVAVHFGGTPVRWLGQVISLFSLLGLVGYVVKAKDEGRKTVNEKRTPKQRGNVNHSLTVIALLLLLGLRPLLDTRPNPFAYSRFDGQTVAGVAPLQLNFDQELILIGVEWPPAPLPADKPIPLRLYWRPQAPPAANYSVSLQLTDAAGHLFGQSDSQHPGQIPTSRWQPGQYAQDNHAISLLPGTPPGAYQVWVAVYQVGGPSLNWLDANAAPGGQRYLLGELQVMRANHFPRQLDMSPMTAIPAGPLTLVGQIPPAAEVMVGEVVVTTLLWQVNHPLDGTVTFRLELAAADGTIWHTQAGTPARSDYPPEQWQIGEIIRTPQSMLVPATLPAGPITWQAVLTSETETFTLPLAHLTVQVPERNFTRPPISYPQEAVFADQIRWLGYDLDADGITLYWQGLALMETSYVAFVHRLDESGRLVAQIDRPPLNGTRPTTSWLPGEILTDYYPLPMTDAAAFAIGFYDPETQVRLGTVMIELSRQP